MIILNSTTQEGGQQNQQKESTGKKFQILKELGKGSFGKVKEALHLLSGEKVAIKIMEKSQIKKEDDQDRVAREIKILSKVNHPNIIQLYDITETDSNYYFVMECAEKGELSYYIEKQDRYLWLMY